MNERKWKSPAITNTPEYDVAIRCPKPQLWVGASDQITTTYLRDISPGSLQASRTNDPAAVKSEWQTTGDHTDGQRGHLTARTTGSHILDPACARRVAE